MSTWDARPRRLVVAWITAMALVAVTLAAPVRAASTTTAIRDWNLNAARAIFNPLSPPSPTLPGAAQTPTVGQIPYGDRADGRL